MKKKYSASQLGSAALVAAIVSGVVTSSSLSFARSNDDLRMSPMQRDQQSAQGNQNTQGGIFPVMNFLMKQRAPLVPNTDISAPVETKTTDEESNHSAAEDAQKPPRDVPPPCAQGQQVDLQGQRNSSAMQTGQERLLNARIAMTQKAIGFAQARLAKATDDDAKTKITKVITVLQTSLTTLQAKLATLQSAPSSTSSLASSDAASSTADTASSVAQ